MDNQEYAGFVTRFVAALLDGLILAVPIGIIVAVLTPAMGQENVSSVSYPLQLLVSAGYYVWYQGKTGQTLGKKVMHIKVVSAANGQTPSMGTFALRELVGKFISGMILMLGYLLALKDPRKQALHDKIANTLVVKVTPNAAPAQPVAPVEPVTPPAQPNV